MIPLQLIRLSFVKLETCPEGLFQSEEFFGLPPPHESHGQIWKILEHGLRVFVEYVDDPSFGKW